MKRFLIFLALILVGNFSFAEDDFVLNASVSFDWVNMEQVERDQAIQNYQNILFTGNSSLNYKKKDFKSKYKDFMKDEKYRTHYRLANAEVKETPYANLCGFFLKDKKVLYMYALQYKDNLNRVFYYDVLGHLRYVDELSEEYPNFPYYSKQYRETGKLVSAIYFIDKDTQYTYLPDMTFNGVWYKDKLFDKDAKQILTRSNW